MDQQTNPYDIKLSSAVAPNFAWLRMCGHWFPENPTKLQHFAYGCYSVLFIGFCFFMSVASEVANIIVSFGDLEKLTAASFLFLTHVAQTLKIIFFLKNGLKIKALARFIDGEMFKPKNAAQYGMIRDCIRETITVYYIFVFMAWVTCLLWGVFPLIDSAEEGVQLPLSGYYPFATDRSPMFQVIYVYQILGTAINATSDVSMDMTASGFMVLVGGQLDLLNDNLENIKEYAARGHGVPQGDELVGADLQKEMDRLLGVWVNHHKNLLRVVDEIGGLFNVGVLSQFAAGCIIICVTMFELTLVSLFSVKFASMLLYQVCMMVEIIIYCWYGNEIILKSSKLSTSAFNSDWTHCSIPYKKNLLFVMLRTTKPIKIDTANLFTLSLDTFAAILRSSWSYFAVLYTVHQD